MKEAFSKLTVLCQLVGQQMKKADRSFPMENGQLNNYVNSVQEGTEQKVPECRK